MYNITSDVFLSNMLPDFGTRRLASIQSVINARREPVQQTSLLQRARQALGGKATLSTLKLQGMIPEDFIEKQVPWSDMHYSIHNCISFGFTWDHMRAMAIQPADLRTFSWKHYKQLHVGAKEMMGINIDVHDLIQLKFSAPQLRELGWTWAMLKDIGATEDILPMTATEIRTYFRNTGGATSVGMAPTKSAVFHF